MAAGDTTVGINTLQGSTVGAKFDGVDDYVQIADDDIFDFNNAGGTADAPFSITAEVKISRLSGTHVVMSKFATVGTQGQWKFDLASGKLRTTLRDESTGKNPRMSADAAIDTYTWVHIATTYDGTGGDNALADPNCAQYVAGAKIASTYTDDGGGYVAMEDGTHTPRIGSEPSGSNFFHGQIRKVRIHNVELTAAEVLQVAQETRVTRGLIGEWLLQSDYTDTGGSLNGTNSGTHFASYEEVVSKAIHDARVTANDQYLLWHSAKNQVGSVNIEEA